MTDHEKRIAWDILRNSTTGRTAAAVAGRMWPMQLVATARRVRNDAVESDRRYFRRRSDEERCAATRATGTVARKAHARLAQLYGDFARSFAPLGAARF